MHHDTWKDPFKRPAPIAIMGPLFMDLGGAMYKPFKLEAPSLSMVIV
jgi:hypothetical protein